MSLQFLLRSASDSFDFLPRSLDDLVCVLFGCGDPYVPPADRESAGEPVWRVELRAHVGRLARSKRLRMARTECDPVARVVTFERQEVDGRRHAPWVLRASVLPGSELHVHLHYGGRLWTGGVLERVLADSIVNGRQRLLALVTPTR